MNKFDSLKLKRQPSKRLRSLLNSMKVFVLLSLLLNVVSYFWQEYDVLPLLIGIGVFYIATVVFIFIKKMVFKNTFSDCISLRQRAIVLQLGLMVKFFFVGLVRNTDAGWCANRYNREYQISVNS